MLPLELSKRLGRDVSFWERILGNPTSKVHRLNLLEGAIEYVVRLAEENEKRHCRSLCHYLEEALYKKVDHQLSCRPT